MKKYEILFDAPEWKIFDRNGHKLYPIRALKDFGNVKAGWYGGRVESEENLSQEGNAWIEQYGEVYGNAKVYDNALVRDASVHDNAKIYGNALVESAKPDEEGFTEICGNVEVYDNAHIRYITKISDNAKIGGDALIQFNGDYICIQGIGSVEGVITAFRDTKLGVAVQSGKFFGSLSEFESKIEEFYGNRKDTKFLRERMYLKRDYMAAISLINTHLNEHYYNALYPFSEQLKAARKKCGLSQAALSNLLQIPERTIAHWEAGENQPPSWAAELLLEKLHTMKQEGNKK